jgi:hypothetical protein
VSDDNVTPIADVHRCASCKLEVRHERRFDPHAHGKDCRQPEIRVKRLEWEIEELKTSLLALARHLLTPGECLAPDAPMYCGGSDLCPNCSTSGQFHGTCGINETLISILNEAAGRKKHGTSESPDTQRSGGPCPNPWEPDADARERDAIRVSRDPRRAHADASPAEPERSATAGPDARNPVRRDP